MDHAAHGGSIELVKFLLGKKASINAHDKDHWTPLHYAARRGKKDIVQTSLYKGANINVRDDKGKIPLDIAQQYGHQDIADLLSAKPFQIRI